MLRIISSEILIATVGLLLLLVAQWLLSTTIIGTNYYGGDGKMVQSDALTALKFGEYFDVTILNPLRTPVSQMLPKNAWANPSFWPFAFLSNETAANVSALLAIGRLRYASLLRYSDSAQHFGVAILYRPVRTHPPAHTHSYKFLPYTRRCRCL